MKRFLTIAFLLSAICHGIITEAQQINIRKYTIDDGLVNNDILNIYQDSRGFIWLCTRGGLSRYDGSRFTNFTPDNGLTSDMINDIYEIAPQEFIIAQNSNGARLLQNGRIGPYMPGSKTTINRFYPVDNRLLATTDGHDIVECDHGTLRPLRPGFSNTISEITRVNDSIWLVHDPASGIQLTNHFLQPWSPVLLMYASTVYTDSRRHTWIGTSSGLKLLDPAIQPGKPIAFLPLPSSFDLPLLRQTEITAVMEDSKGNYWMGTIAGLVKINRNGTSRLYTRQHGLPPSVIKCIREDRQNNIWIGTSVGLARFSLHDEINTVTPDFGPFYDGVAGISPITANRMRLFGAKVISELDLPTGTLTNTRAIPSPHHSLYKLNGNEWLMTNGRKGVIYHSGESDVRTIPWPEMDFNAVIKIDTQHFVGVSDKKVFVISNGHYTKKLTADVGSQIYTMTFDRKNVLWAGTWSNGLLGISIEREADSLQLKIIDTIASLLPDQHIRAIFSDRKKELWIGTRYKGVIRLLERTKGKYELQQYGTAQDLSSNFVLTINRDSSGNIWVGSTQGLDKLIPTGNHYRVFNFGKLKKLPSEVIDIHFLPNHSVLAISASSVVHARDRQEDTLPPPPVYITNVTAGPADTASLLYAGLIHRPYNNGSIYFEYSAPQFVNEDATKFSYRLLGGSDTTWAISGRSHNVYFANLRPGNYTFQVRALGFNEIWGEPAVYSFRVNSPYWQKAWFILVMLALVGLLIYTFYRYRINQLMRMQQVRNRIATDLHDEIGSTLTNINILTSLGKRNLSQPQKTNDFLQRISEEVQSSSQALDDIIWSVNTSHDTLDETIARMRRYAAELFDANDTRYEFYLDPAFEEKKLAMEQRRDIYLLYKEAVNNISKHAAAKQVNIRMTIDHGQLLLSIRDDGKGFDTAEESFRHGLQGMQERVSKWKGRIMIESARQKGVSIQIRLPLSKQG